MEKNIEELYEILDELNAQIEEIVNEFEDPETLELVISKLGRKAKDFVYEFQQDMEKLDLIEMEQ